MKNYYFERDLERQIKKAQRDVEICALYNSLGSISKVADRLNMSRNTVRKIINSDVFVKTQQGNYAVIPLGTTLQEK